MLFVDYFSEHYLPDLQTAEALELFYKDNVIVADNIDRPGQTPPYLEYVRAEGGGKVNYESSIKWTEGERPMGVEISHVVGVWL